MEPRVGNKYRLGRKIGSGSFGEIYLGNFSSFLVEFLFLSFLGFVFTDLVFASTGTNIQTNDEVAIKLVSLLFPCFRLIVCFKMHLLC